eukprot:SAG31_NODE_23383_length_505_cov_1.298030_1_plen_22_part_10
MALPTTTWRCLTYKGHWVPPTT